MHALYSLQLWTSIEAENNNSLALTTRGYRSVKPYTVSSLTQVSGITHAVKQASSLTQCQTFQEVVAGQQQCTQRDRRASFQAGGIPAQWQAHGANPPVISCGSASGCGSLLFLCLLLLSLPQSIVVSVQPVATKITGDLICLKAVARSQQLKCTGPKGYSRMKKGEVLPQTDSTNEREKERAQRPCCLRAQLDLAMCRPNGPGPAFKNLQTQIKRVEQRPYGLIPKTSEQQARRQNCGRSSGP
eukprot:scaffold53172_cov18-Tisochrysis_lutea.AAC.1